MKTRSALVLRILLTGILLLTGWSLLEGSQIQPLRTAVVRLPRGPVSRIPSPDGKWNLVFECPNDCKERKLWIEEVASRNRRAIKEYERSLDVSWAPNSHFFFVNDASGSTDTRCFVYEIATLREIDLEKMILASDAGASEFLRAGHSYLKARYWINSHELLVILEGHNDGAPPGGFGLRYRINLNGQVIRLSQHVER